ncbi:MAG: DUF3945 domain-containing protein [Bacteroidales bacterium]
MNEKIKDHDVLLVKEPSDEKGKAVAEIDEDKKALLETGNFGKLIDLKILGKEDVRAFVRINKLSNDLVTLNAQKIRIHDEVKGVKITDEQKKSLQRVKVVYMKGMKDQKENCSTHTSNLTSKRDVSVFLPLRNTKSSSLHPTTHSRHRWRSIPRVRPTRRPKTGTNHYRQLSQRRFT